MVSVLPLQLFAGRNICYSTYKGNHANGTWSLLCTCLKSVGQGDLEVMLEGKDIVCSSQVHSIF